VWANKWCQLALNEQLLGSGCRSRKRSLTFSLLNLFTLSMSTARLFSLQVYYTFYFASVCLSFLAFDWFSVRWRDALRPIVWLRMRRIVGGEGLLNRMSPTLETAGLFWPLLVASAPLESLFESLLKGRSLSLFFQFNYPSGLMEVQWITFSKHLVSIN